MSTASGYMTSNLEVMSKQYPALTKLIVKTLETLDFEIHIKFLK